MDIASILGLVVCLGMVFLGIVTGDEGIAGLANFYNLESIFIKFGGYFSCKMILF